jgi:hypothetical protein
MKVATEQLGAPLTVKTDGPPASSSLVSCSWRATGGVSVFTQDYRSPDDNLRSVQRDLHAKTYAAERAAVSGVGKSGTWGKGGVRGSLLAEDDDQLVVVTVVSSAPEEAKRAAAVDVAQQLLRAGGS